MTPIWIAVIAACLGCYATKLAGASVPHDILDKPVVKADPEVRFNFGNVGRGGGPALNDVVAGHADLSCLSAAVAVELTKAGKRLLDDVAAKIKALSPVEQVVVLGHADPTGKAKSNRVL